MNEKIGRLCGKCDKFGWTPTRAHPCPHCGAYFKVSGPKHPGIISNVLDSPQYHRIGPKGTMIRSKYHMREVMKAESDRNRTDLRFADGD